MQFPYTPPMPHRDHDTRLRDLRTLAAQADQIKAAADDLLQTVEAQLESARADAPAPITYRAAPRRRRRRLHRKLR